MEMPFHLTLTYAFSFFISSRYCTKFQQRGKRMNEFGTVMGDGNKHAGYSHRWQSEMLVTLSTVHLVINKTANMISAPIAEIARGLYGLYLVFSQPISHH